MTAKTFFGLEEVLKQELIQIGAKNVKAGNRAVTFEGDNEVLYKANLHLRTALKILLPIKQFRARNEQELYDRVKKVNWAKYIDLDGTFAIDSTVWSETFTHSKFVALKVKDAIADHFTEIFKRRPNVDVNQPDIQIHIHISQRECILSLDSSGESLHRRGYRSEQRQAPLNEVLAAGIILLTGWKGDRPFLDPMCGSGTLLVEAAMIASNTAPGIKRKFAFMNWKQYDRKLWNQVFREAKRAVVEIEVPIVGSDIDREAIDISFANAERSGLDEDLRISKNSFFDRKAIGENGIIVCNPPYGERIGKDIEELYKQMGDKLKQDFSGYDAWIFSGNMRALKFVGLRPSKRIELYNGAIECRLAKYEMYRGGKKD
ncbi:class I SAM-dependent RNA methyltransferase [Flammeovirga kamogawensis]|uniref:Class I SAM-dependent RNA methyltransferase n=2 Tax=Flammeovirga kamogawensis TaxID=373891 RepID=A0ABX8H0N3_9BACT|nr:class I SAM-dependent RNA methyltransferase [Flammeovirga kamogawensis]TRX70161.1 class I SAM-dependent RNA methyltransferase [Flammeovirga kamogawensis]